MFATTKKKRVFTLSILIALIVMVLAGVTLGVYFLVKDNNNLTLSKRQAVFGRAVNSAVIKPQEEEVDISMLPNGVQAKNVVGASDRYYVIKTSSSIYVVYDKVTRTYVDIGSKINYDSIIAIYGSLVVLSYNSHQMLFNLDSLESVVDLANIDYTFDSGYLLLTSNNKTTFNISENSSLVTGLYVCAINVANGNLVYEAKAEDKIVNATISNGLLITVCADATSVYKLGNILSLKKHYENEFDVAADFSNVNSLLTDSAYYLTNYNRVFVLSERILLIENSKVVSGSDYDISGNLSNGQHRNYKNNYFIVDLENNIQIKIEHDDFVIEAESISLANNYFAVVKIPIYNKQTMLIDEKLISYYQIAKVEGEYKLIKLVEYDFSSYGKVVGYNGKGLFTSGGAKSTFIDFDGNIKEFSALEEENSKITQSTYNDAVVVSSVQGEKKIYDNDSNLLVGKVFTQVSPFVDGSAVALFGDQYYLVSNSGLVRTINGFAEEFSKYVFMGIGYFFAGEEGEYKVYNHSGDLLYNNVDVKIEYNETTHKVSISIQGDGLSKVIVVNPIEDIFTTKSLINYFETVMQERTFAPVQKATVDGEIYIDKKVDYTSSTENHEAGGVAQKVYNISFSNLGALVYRTYSSLNTKEASMIPGFNQGATGQQIYRVDAENSTDGKEHIFTFEGVYFVGDYEYYTLALIRLQENADYYYMVTLAVKDAYLSRVSALSKMDSGGGSTHGKFYDYRTGQISYTSALSGTDSLILSYSDLKTKLIAMTWLEGGKPDQTPYSPSGQDIEITPRQVDLETAGFDGGIVFTTTEANILNISFTIRNTYESTAQKSLAVANGETKDCGRYTVSYIGSALRINAKAGYFLTYFDIHTGSSTDASYTNISSSTLVGGSADVIASAEFRIPHASYVQLKNVTIVESYSYLSLIRYNKTIQEKLDEGGNVVLNEDEEPVLEVVELEEFEELGLVYFYYGYGSDVRTERNYAQLGFSEFKKRTSIEIPEKDGYTFLSYTLVDIEEKNIRTPIIEIINKDGGLAIVPGTDAVSGEEQYYADTYLVPRESLVTTYYLEAIYEANLYTINYYMDKYNYNLGINELYDTNDNLTRKQILTEIKYYDYVTELHDITKDDYNLDNNFVPTAPTCNYRGLDFKGWFYIDDETGEEKELKVGDIYTKVGVLRVYAKWEAQEYTLEFDANVGATGAYNGITVGGYIYDIDSAYYTERFVYTNKDDASLNLNIAKGTTFDQGNLITKKIKYAGMYGVLPTIAGITEISQGVEEDYIFLGWFAHKELNATNENYEALITGVDTNGNDIIQFKRDDFVNVIPPVVDEETGERKLTVYAHYKRVVYSYSLTSTVDSRALDDNNEELPFDIKYTVEGSNTIGVQSKYSTDQKFASYNGGTAYEGVDCNKWTLQDAVNPVYTFYGVQGEEVKINAFVGEGYYISAIVYQLPDYDGGSFTSIKRAVWESDKKDEYAFAEGVESPGASGHGIIYEYCSGFNIQILLDELYSEMAEFDSDTPLCATIELQFTSMKFKNEFTISGVDEDGEVTPGVGGDGRVTNDKGEAITKQENIIYGYTNTYRAVSGTTTSSSTIANSYLKQLTLDEVVLIRFEYEYGYEGVPSSISANPVFYHIMTANVTPKNAVWAKDADGTTYKTTLYELSFEDGTGTLILAFKLTYYYMKHDLVLNYYTYEFSIKSKQNHVVDACFADIRSSVDFKLYDSDYSAGDAGLIPNENLEDINKRATISVTKGDNYYDWYYTEDGDKISPNQYIRYNILPTENYFISSISISYNDINDRYIVAYPTIGINNDGGSVNIVQTAGFEMYGNSSPLSRTENTVLFKSTNITISWLSGRGFSVTINQVLHDVSINLTMLEYKLFQVQTPGTKDTTFEITEALETAKANSFPTSAAIPVGIYYYTETGIVGSNQEYVTYCNWVIAGAHDDLETITVKPDIKGKVSYKVRSVIPSGMNDVIRIDEDGFAQYNIKNTSANGHKAAVELVADTAGFMVTSYLGRGTQKMDSIIDSGVVPYSDTEAGHIYTLDTNAFTFGGYQGPFSLISATYSDPITAEEATKNYDHALINVSFTGGTIIVTISEIEGYKLSSLIVELYLVETGAGGVGDDTKVYTRLPDAISVVNSGTSAQVTITIPKLKNSEYELRVFQKPIEYEVVYNNANPASGTNLATGTVEPTKHLYNVPSTIRTDAVYEKEGYTAIGYSKERRFGTVLTESDCYFLLPGFVDPANKNKSSSINENLWTGKENDANKTVTLYAIYKANIYNIIYNTNDNSVGNGSSPAKTKNERAKKVTFDTPFDALNEITRFGYVFNGWYSQAEGGTKVKEGDTLNLELFNKIKNPDDEESVVLYAQYSAKTFTIVVDLNDISNGNGTSIAQNDAGSLRQELTFDDNSKVFAYPTISRIGYDYKGLRSERTNAADAKALTAADYLSATDFNWSFMVSSGFDEGEIDQIDASQRITIYATYVPKVFKIYINLNNVDMANYGSDVTVTYDARTYVEKDHYVDGLEIPIEFDALFGTLPTVDMPGYTMIGFYESKADVGENTTQGLIISSTKFDILLFDKLTYTDSSNIDTSLETLYESGQYKFSIYAQYDIKQILISTSGTTSSISTIVDSVSGYSVTTGTSFGGGTSSAIGDYGCSGIIDLLPANGKYISSLTISYTGKSGSGVITITFAFNNVSETLSYTASGGTGGSLGSFTKLNGSYADVAKGMYIQKTGYKQYTNSLSTFRVILGFDFLMESVVVEAVEESLMFNTIFMVPTTSGGWAQHAQKLVAYGSTNFTSGISYPTLTGKSFRYWSFDQSGSSTISGHSITENTTLYAYFIDATGSSSSVSFWVWNPDTSAYELVDVVSCSSGREFTGTMPSPSTDAWPGGSSYYFSGWVVRMSKPSSALFQERGTFDSEYIVSGDVNVYSCYHNKGFSEPSYSTSVTARYGSYISTGSTINSTKAYTLDDVGTLVYDYRYYTRYVYFEVTIRTTDLYKYEYNRSGEYAPVRFYDYVTHVARITEDGYYSRNIDTAFGEILTDVTSPNGSRTINVNSYSYSLTDTYTYKIVKKQRTYEVDVKDEEGNVIGKEQKVEDYAAAEYVGFSSNESEMRREAYDALENKTCYFVVFLTPRDKGGNYESFAYTYGGVSYYKFFTLNFPRP